MPETRLHSRGGARSSFPIGLITGSPMTKSIASLARMIEPDGMKDLEMSLKKITSLVMLFTLLSRTLGVGREMVIAWRFGASAESDAFFLAFSIPYAFFSIVGISLTAAIVPILAQYDAIGDRESGMEVASSAVNLVALVSAVLALAGVIFATQIATAMGGNFPPATLHLASNLTAVMMPSIVFMSVAGVTGGILNNYNVYGTPAAGPVVMNIVIIVSALFGGLLGVKILVFGTLLGSFSYFAVQVPSFFKIKFKYRFKILIKNSALRYVTRNVWSTMALSGCYYSYNVIDFNLASGMPRGTITTLNYATKFIQLPQGLFMIAVTTAIFPSLSSYAARNEMSKVRDLLEKGLRAILLLAIPCSIGLLIIGYPVMLILFQRGLFNEGATNLAYHALMFLTVGLVGFSLNLPLIRSFYSMHDQTTPLYVAVVSVGIKFGLSLWLGGLMLQNGLALATSITYLVNAAIMLTLLQRRLPGLIKPRFGLFILKAGLASAVMAAVVYLQDHLLAQQFGASRYLVAARLGFDVATGALCFIAVARNFKIEEIEFACQQAARRIRKIVFGVE
jgi:putative peptidoglycan lipid II flippase